MVSCYPVLIKGTSKIRQKAELKANEQVAESVGWEYVGGGRVRKNKNHSCICSQPRTQHHQNDLPLMSDMHLSWWKMHRLIYKKTCNVVVN